MSCFASLSILLNQYRISSITAVAFPYSVQLGQRPDLLLVAFSFGGMERAEVVVFVMVKPRAA